MEGFSGSFEHLLAELERIDLLIQAAVSRAQQIQGDAQDEFQGLYIPDEEVDRLLARPAGLPAWAGRPGPPGEPGRAEALATLAARNAQRATAGARAGADLRLPALARACDLEPFDVEALLVALAPEIDLRYERLYAYLQDDVTRKRPSVDLILNLLSPSYADKIRGRQRFASQAPLLRHGLVTLFDDPGQQQPPLLARYVKTDERVVNYLLGADGPDARLLPYARSLAPQACLADLLLPADFKQRLAGLTRVSEPAPVIYFQGPYGVGKQMTAEALCQQLGRRLLVVDGRRIVQAQELALETAVRLSLREALLQGAVLYWDGFDDLLADEHAAWRAGLLAALEGRSDLVILAGNTTWEPAGVLRDRPFVRVEFPRPDYGQRLQLWHAALPWAAHDGAGLDLPGLAGKFRFSGGQIQDAASTARNLARWRDPGAGEVTAPDLKAACRLQSNRRLGALARHITPHYVWDDIVLLPDRTQQLREICNYVKYRGQVYEVWGFEGKLALGRGLNALFAGPSGTGKTMAADIIACELGLDMYKIDLANVVSKYIGETEKNLARIFDEAQDSNAILFFDEADALFGKRSEVRDSHDRYANIEIGYLLQKMEEYEGIVILATNLRKNMDDAFVRRLHFTVDFPFPGEADRRRIWEGIWPHATPRSADVDLDFMARRFEITGGNIRNIALAAAFLAADDGGMVKMHHLVRATQREYQKMGKVAVEGEFGPYAALLRRDT